MELKDFQLTGSDFDLLMEGLDELPNKGQTGLLLGGLFGTILADRMNPEGRQKVEADQRLREDEHKRKIDSRKEDITILKGKLAMLKRLMQTQGALKSVENIINQL